MRSYALALTYVIAAFGFTIISFIFITSRVPVPCVQDHDGDSAIIVRESCLTRLVDDVTAERRVTTLIDLDVIKRDDDGQLRLLNDGVISNEETDRYNTIIDLFGNKFSPVTTDFTRTSEIPTLWFFLFIYLLLAPLSFFGTLGIAHAPMQQVKRSYLETLSNVFNREYRAVHGTIGGDSPDVEKRINRLKYIRELHQITESFPVWPWDGGSIRQFATAVSSPILIAGASLLVQEFLF